MSGNVIKGPFYNSGFYDTGAGGGGGTSDLPIVGELAHEWNFKDSFTDSIGGVIAVQKNPGGNTSLGFPVFHYSHGIFLNVLCQIKDYVEIKFSSKINVTTNYVRMINKSDSSTVDDTSAFIIGPSNYKWASYFSTWYNDLTDFEFISKIGIYLKNNTTMDVFFDDVLVKENFVNDWGTKNVSKNKYSLGATTSSYADNNMVMGAIRARIYRNAERIK